MFVNCDAGAQNPLHVLFGFSIYSYSTMNLLKNTSFNRISLSHDIFFKLKLHSIDYSTNMTREDIK